MNRAPLRILVIVGLLEAVSQTTATAGSGDADNGFQSLFNGKTFDGWKKVGGGATYHIEGDEIVGEVGPGSNTFLRTEKTYGDFILKVDLKLDIPGNSGLQFRSHQKESQDGNGRVYGYQAEVDPSARAWSAGIYDEGARGWLYHLTGHPEAQKAFKVSDWNTYVIEARGPHLKTTLNGIPCADLLDTQELEGFIALQVHAGKAGRVRWKNILLKDLGRSEWKPIWDGKTLNGWREIGGGHWAIEDGAIHGTSSAGEKQHGLLISRDSLGDFAVRLKFQDGKGNSGLYFRAEEVKDDLGVNGLQAEISSDADAGGLYETGGRGWIARPDPPKDSAPPKKEAKPKMLVKPDGWNELSVVALGDRIVVLVNGVKTAEVRDEKGRKRGNLALQLHGGQDMDVRFKDIEILELQADR